ncbi:Putative peroxiredoxin bcp [Piscirickettsia salmonis]|uniref:thioredoxin-dependent peroxiredoxin n=1 Tax=Piscirickettsia salmonis TaxID=1238 RepID=A0A1L6TAY4_PISSA|nr:peroxiredoxin [Piscirickettsia salmonis]AKP73666.1 peroxiredoxin [Piscirickettsia salmonis LF-89 = ATCC VR-1361]ALB22454.1 AhpC [Piscirickettsia salmonis]ALY02517.1 peroxiredoxin [Piscirickettsia salmonis]AMA42038.1 peroxiredoxin [Piscirickettsia salmonis]AOS34506.1 peroxiredoxin [Piscirickettsia salmonis]
MDIRIDQAIPHFSAQATGETPVDSQALKGKNWVIYFYPRDNTPGCTTEGQEFRDAKNDFNSCNTAIFGVSKDSLHVHEGFKAKHSFPFELISDPEETLCQLFGVIQLKKLYGKEYLGIERSTFFIDEQGILRQEWRKVKVKGHVADVLSTVQKLTTK